LDEDTVTASPLNSFKHNMIRQRKWLCLWTYTRPN